VAVLVVPDNLESYGYQAFVVVLVTMVVSEAERVFH
jgi:hypothetical protein